MQSNKIVYQRRHYYYIKRRDSLSSTLDASKISTLVECTLQMERTFPSRYKHLVNCHWFDIYSNHRSCLTDQQLQLVKQRVKAMYTLSFSSPPMFVLAIKRVIEALWKNKTTALSTDDRFEPHLFDTGFSQFREAKRVFLYCYLRQYYWLAFEYKNHSATFYYSAAHSADWIT